MIFTASKVSIFEVFLVRIFPFDETSFSHFSHITFSHFLFDQTSFSVLRWPLKLHQLLWLLQFWLQHYYVWKSSSSERPVKLIHLKKTLRKDFDKTLRELNFEISLNGCSSSRLSVQSYRLPVKLQKNNLNKRAKDINWLQKKSEQI